MEETVTVFLTFKEPRNRFQRIDSASLKGRYDKPVTTYSVPSLHRLF